MSPIGNGHDRQTTVGLDIGACTITCAIGQIIPETKRVKLYFLRETYYFDVCASAEIIAISATPYFVSLFSDYKNVERFYYVFMTT